MRKKKANSKSDGKCIAELLKESESTMAKCLLGAGYSKGIVELMTTEQMAIFCVTELVEDGNTVRRIIAGALKDKQE